MASKVRSAFAYYGGKSFYTPWICNIFKRYTHKCYIECFGGGGSVLFAKEPSELEIYNDVYSNVVNFYAMLKDPDKYRDLLFKIRFTPYSREAWQACYDRLWGDEPLDDVERAYCYYTVTRQSFSGQGKNWVGLCTADYKMLAEKWTNQYPHRFVHTQKNLARIHYRLKKVFIENRDAVELIKKKADKNVLIYCDPPYVASTRSQSDDYVHEYSDEQHKELVQTLLSVPGHKVLSGYESPIYQPLLDARWDLFKLETVLRTGNIKGGSKNRQKRTECVYCSPVADNSFEFPF